VHVCNSSWNFRLHCCGMGWRLLSFRHETRRLPHLLRHKVQHGRSGQYFLSNAIRVHSQRLERENTEGKSEATVLRLRMSPSSLRAHLFKLACSCRCCRCGFAHFGLQSPPIRAKRICASGCFDCATEAQSGVGIMPFLCNTESVPKVFYGNHRRDLHRT
jgi:hypothetical protein